MATHASGSRVHAYELALRAVVDAIKIATLNGATHLGRGALIGSIQAGKLADLVVRDGNPAADTSAVRKVSTVLRQGVGYDPQAIFERVRGKAGLW